jgi:S-layer protein
MGMNAAAVQRLYVAYFNRPADPISLAVYEAMLPTDTAATQAELLVLAGTYFSPSTEYTTNFAGLSNAQIVEKLYQNIFGRAAEAEGLTAWAVALTDGSQTVASLALQLSYSAQGTDADTVNNRIEAATAFTTGLTTSDEITGYSGDAAAASARTWLATVTDDASATSAIAGVDTAISNAVSATTSVTGKTFTLTQNGDVFDLQTATAADVTTAGDDTFRALSDGDLGNADLIDGAGGSDVMNVNMTEGAAPVTVQPQLTSVETINVTTTAIAGDNTTTLNLTDSTGTTAVNVNVVNDFDFTVAGITTATATTFIGAVAADTEATVTLRGLSATLDGGQDAYTVGVNNADLGVLTVAGVEELTLNASGADTDIAVLTAAALEKLVITGGSSDASVTTEDTQVGSGTAVNFAGLDTPVGGTQEVAVIDASTSTGAVNIATDDDAAAMQVTGGAGLLTLNNTADNGVDNANMEVTVTAGAGGVNVTLQGGGNLAADTAINMVTVTGSDVADTVSIAALAAPTNLTSTGVLNEANGINATVNTADGADTITINAGNVSLNTGDGNDTIVVGTWANVTATDSIDMGAGTGDVVSTSEVTLSSTEAATMARFVGADVINTSATAEKTINLGLLGTVTTASASGTHARTAQVAGNGATAGGDALDFTSSNANGRINISENAAFTGRIGQANNTATAGAGGTALDLNASLDNGDNQVTVTLVENVDLTGGVGGNGTAGNANGGAGGSGLDANEYEEVNIVLSATDATVDVVTILGAAGGTENGNGNAGAAGSDVIVGANGKITITEALSGNATAASASAIDLNDIVGTNVTVDASTINGAVDITSTQGNATITTGAGADDIATSTGVDIIDLGAGKDIVDGQATGRDVITTGAGSDIVSLAEGDSVEVSMKTITDFTLMASAYTSSAANDTAAEIQATDSVGTSDIIRLANTNQTIVANKVASDTTVDIGASTDIQDAINNGIMTLSGADAAAVDTLAEWIDQAEAAIGADQAVAFVFGGDTYVVAEDGTPATSLVIKLTGVSALGLDEVQALDTATEGGTGYVLIAGA